MSNVSLVGKEEDKTKEDEEEKEGAIVKIQMLRDNIGVIIRYSRVY
jgi:hypothetical protein